jgi:hypothetical protein
MLKVMLNEPFNISFIIQHSLFSIGQCLNDCAGSMLKTRLAGT